MTRKCYCVCGGIGKKFSTTNFSNVEDVRKWVDDYFDWKQPSFYHRGIHQLFDRWQKTIDSNDELLIFNFRNKYDFNKAVFDLKRLLSTYTPNILIWFVYLY